MSDTKASPPATIGRRASTDRGEPHNYSAATVRKAIIQVLATRAAGTPREIESAVGELLPSADRASIAEQLETLREGDYVVGVPSKAGRVTLSERGQSWWTGIEALALTAD
jgi:uncharacterized protein YceH (UPF0502 family)